MSYVGKTDWKDNEIVEASDMNRIEQGIEDLDSEKQDNINTLNSKASIVDADNLVITDSAESSKPKRTPFSVVKATLKQYFDALYTTASTRLTGYSKATTSAPVQPTDTVNTAFGKVEKSLDGKANINLSNVAGAMPQKTSVVDNDNILIADSQQLNNGKKVTFSTFKTALKGYFDGLYTSAKMKLTGYSKSTTVSEVNANDTVNTAIGKVSKNLDAKANADLSNVSGTVANKGWIAGQDFFFITDSEDSNKTKKASFATMKLPLTQYFNTLYTSAKIKMTGYRKATTAAEVTDTDTINTAVGKLSKNMDYKANSNLSNVAASVSSKTSIADNDNVFIADSAASNLGKKATFSVVKSNFKTYFDGLYTSARMRLTGYSKATSVSDISATDTVNTAFGKVSKNLDNKANIDLGNVSNSVFKDKALASGVSGQLAGNRMRVYVTVTSFDNNNIEGRNISAYGGTDVPTSTAVTDADGKVMLEVESGNYSVSITDVPPTYIVPPAVSVGPQGGKEYTVSFNMEEKVATVYGVRLFNDNSKMELDYIEGAAGFQRAKMTSYYFDDGGWLYRWPFNQIKPCLFKEGKVVGYLNPNNLAEFEDGSAADITSGNAGDVMVEFPKIYYKMDTDVPTGGQNIVISDTQRVGSKYYWSDCFDYDDIEADKVYIGAYYGWKDSSGKLRSLSGKIPTEMTSVSSARSYAQANGSGYEVFPQNKLLLLRILYLIMFAHKDGEKVLGQGHTSYGNEPLVYTGRTDTDGICYGTNYSNKLCFLHIEDFWGNGCGLVEGAYLDNYSSTYTEWEYKFSDGRFGATNLYRTAPQDLSATNGYIGSVSSQNGLELVGYKNTDKYDNTASESTGFCDEYNYSSGGAGKKAILCGGYGQKKSGPFYSDGSVDYDDFTRTYQTVVARLTYCAYKE